MIFPMDTNVITSEPPATATKAKKRKMSAAGRKAIAEAAKARWAAKKSTVSSESHSDPASAAPVPTVPAPPSPAVLKLQEQVVELVSQRHQARSFLNEAHNAYLAAQSRFQAAESELKGIEQEVQYRIGLIAQLENRPSANPLYPTPTSVLQMPAANGSITSEPAQQQQIARKLNQETFAVGSADDLRREVRGMM